MGDRLCPAAAISPDQLNVRCSLVAGHHPPHFDRRLGVWWSIPPHHAPAEDGGDAGTP